MQMLKKLLQPGIAGIEAEIKKQDSKHSNNATFSCFVIEAKSP